MKKKRTLKERICDIQLAGGFLKQSMKQAFNLANGKEVVLRDIAVPYGDLEYREKDIVNTDGFVIHDVGGKRVLHAAKINVYDRKLGRDGFTAFEYFRIQPVSGMLDITGVAKQINTKCGKKIMNALKVVDCPTLKAVDWPTLEAVDCLTLKADMFDEVCDCAEELLYSRRPDIGIRKCVDEIKNILEKEANK